MKRFAGIFAVLLIGALIAGCEQLAGPGASPPGETAEEQETPKAEERPEAVTYTAAANGVNGEEDSTALVFTFNADVADLSAEDIGLTDGTDENGGKVVKGTLAGSGRVWTLGITVERAGTVTVRINKEGIEGGEKPVTVFKAGEISLISYGAAADGNSRKTSARIDFTFGVALTGLGTEDITVTGGTGSVTAGALSGGGQAWFLEIDVEKAGDVRVRINRAGIEGGEKTVTVYRALGWDAEADGAGGTEASTVLAFTFEEAVTDLSAGDISLGEDTGLAYALALSGGGTGWSLGITVIRAGNIKVSVGRDGIDGGEKTVAVHTAGEESPATESEERKTTGIVIVSPPNLTYYAAGQPFDLAGLETAWLYSDGTTQSLASGEYSVDAVDTSTMRGLRRVYIHAGGFDTSFDIYISNSTRVLTGVTMDSPPSKTVYEMGEGFSKTGLKLTGTYSDGTTAALSTSAAGVRNFDSFRRGAQTVSVSINGYSFDVPVTVTVPSAATVSLNPYPYDSGALGSTFYKDAYIKGEAFNLADSSLIVTVKFGAYTVFVGPGSGLEDKDISGYQKDIAGKQTLTLNLDGKTRSYEVAVIDTESGVWFDYGYMRHAGDPEGKGPGTGKYYARPGEALVIAPVRYLIGYSADHQDLGASYAWSVSGASWSAPGSGEFLYFTPQTEGTYTVRVDVTGRNYITGQTETKTASTEVVCYSAALPGGTFASPLRNFAPGQYSSGGSGYGWSLGALGGYEVWRVNHRDSYYIIGNAFSGWSEPGIIWVQEDRNGNNLPDETWYELKGSDDDDPRYKDLISRRHAVAWFKTGYSVHTANNGYAGITAINGVYWVDSSGRAAFMGPSGWASQWGVTGNQVTYTCTRIRNDGVVHRFASSNDFGGYVDSVQYGKWVPHGWFYISDAIRADGASVTLTAVRFVKVQTAYLGYGNPFWDVSTEIVSGTDLPDQSNGFPMPWE
jgi:hypothetical protein